MLRPVNDGVWPGEFHHVAPKPGSPYDAAGHPDGDLRKRTRSSPRGCAQPLSGHGRVAAAKDRASCVAGCNNAQPRAAKSNIHTPIASRATTNGPKSAGVSGTMT